MRPEGKHDPSRRCWGAIAVLYVAVAALAPREAAAWQVVYPSIDGYFFGTAGKVRIDADGNIIATGGASGSFRVVKLDQATGNELWRLDLPASTTPPSDLIGVSQPCARDLTGHPSGDYIAAGVTRQNITRNDFTVARVSPTDGTLVWRTDIDGPVHGEDEAFAVAVDAAGDVYAAGRIRNQFDYDFLAVKLSGADGSEIWRRVVDGSGLNLDDRANAVILDGSGAVFFAGVYERAYQANVRLVLKLDAATGAESWRREITMTGDPSSQFAGVTNGVATVSGDFLVSGHVATPTGTFAVTVRLASADGSEIWRREIFELAYAAPEITTGFTTDVSGNPITSLVPSSIRKLSAVDGTDLWQLNVSGYPHKFAHAPGGVLFGGSYETLVRVDEATGGLLWAQPFPRVNDLAPTLDGNVAAATVNDQFRHGCCDPVFGIAKFDGQKGGNLAAGKRLKVTDDISNPFARRLKVVGGPHFGVGSSTDSSIEIRNPTTGESEVFALPFLNWRTSASPLGYKYTFRDPLYTGGCGKVVLKPPETFRADCRLVSFTLDESSQGGLWVIFTGQGVRHCMYFGGDSVIRDESTDANGRGRFLARNALPPTACPD